MFDHPCCLAKTAFPVAGCQVAYSFVVSTRWGKFDLRTMEHCHLDVQMTCALLLHGVGIVVSKIKWIKEHDLVEFVTQL